MKTLSRIFSVLGLLAAAGVLASGVAAAPVVGDCSPAGGMFVIGDGNATVGSTVTFWGAQWWKLNSLSGGSAPASFKGFALCVATDGRSFTTVPGNSPPPPDGPLPACINVLVASSVQKSGPTISGTVTGSVLVQTNPGYEGNPGHEGTGKVVSDCGPL